MYDYDRCVTLECRLSTYGRSHMLTAYIVSSYLGPVVSFWGDPIERRSELVLVRHVTRRCGIVRFLMSRIYFGQHANVC